MDVFDSVSSLFEEFEKDRTSSGLFISYEKTDDGIEDKSKIIFRVGDSESDTSSDESDKNENESRTYDENESLTQEEGEGSSFIVPSNLFFESERTIGNADRDGLDASSTNASQFKLVHEKNKFQKFANLIDSTRFVADEESPGCQILFQNNRFSRKYRLRIEQFMYSLLMQDAQDPERIAELDLKSSVHTCVDINNKLPSSHRTSDMWSAHAIIGCSQFHREFIVDSLGWPLIGNNPCLTEGWHTPKYEQVYTEALPVGDEDQSARPQRPKATCFNCGGEHMISECPKPKDFRQISINKKKFIEAQGLQKQSSLRYHADDEGDPRFAKFKPGVISEDLRQALGITAQELPLYIYRMRVCGYPPGWLEEAKVSTSGISMFDKHGKEVNLDGDNMEDGEVDLIPNEGELDADKIIEYPGFSGEVPEGVRDDSAVFDFPPLQPHQLKSTLKAQIEAVSEMRKRRNEDEEDGRRKKMRTESSQDMDLSGVDEDLNISVSNGEFCPPLPVDTPPTRPPIPKETPPPTPEEFKPKLDLAKQFSSSSSKSSRSSSPTLEELEKQYKMLQQGLEDAEGGASDVDLQIVDSVEASDEDLDSDTQELIQMKEQLVRCGSTTSIQTFGELGTGSPMGSAPGTPIVLPGGSGKAHPLLSHKSVSVSRDFGTPILKTEVSEKSLPDSSKFSVGIEDHIPYENLPDATGSFNKMRGLIQTIRQKVSFRKKKSKS
ncbi:hypothetical protein FSP39_018388 [Pinctada imbricata]|uniref:PSP proline-rich domain-containing protein n=1 Tax=Pinctada imbricata TaxID=66713 RepID=A0AA89BW46_PINIB|nr:hypothetical protein FSP39_018388 [Pinctada imbricata]